MKIKLAALALVGITGCTNPVAPTTTSFTCFTQPRTYCRIAVTGELYCWKETDSYTQPEPCPARRID